MTLGSLAPALGGAVPFPPSSLLGKAVMCAGPWAGGLLPAEGEAIQGFATENWPGVPPFLSLGLGFPV